MPVCRIGVAMNQVDVLQTTMACNASGGSDFTSTLLLFSGLLLIVYFTLCVRRVKSGKARRNDQDTDQGQCCFE